MCDAGGFYDCLVGIYEGKADLSILDTYSEVRRSKYKEIVDPLSSENIVRLFGQDPDKALENDELIKLCKKADKHPDFSSVLWLGMNILKYDLTQCYRTASADNAENATQNESMNKAPPRLMVGGTG